MAKATAIKLTRDQLYKLAGLAGNAKDFRVNTALDADGCVTCAVLPREPNGTESPNGWRYTRVRPDGTLQPTQGGR